jgi:LDH2 family malate/lactate/ureidoglycolate dehydrogenase
MPTYLQRVHAGLAGGTEALSVVCEFGALCRIDAGHALGPAAAVKSLDHAMALARTHGISLVAVGGSTHFGYAGYYARRAARADMVCVVMTNSVKRMAPYGAAERFLGTNPLAIGVPLCEHDPFVLDMATSVEAGGKIIRAKELGQEIPLGIALDRDGLPTSDPARALEGSLLPIGGPKGSGLALAISLLAVLLGGADCDDQMASLHNDFDRPQSVGHVFIVADTAQLRTGQHIRRADEMVDRLLALTPAGASSEVRYPGQARAALARRHWTDGVPIELAELTLAAETCRACDLPDLADKLLQLQLVD